jgi:O-acetyl-ADP-ribose deacetylase (regulator of RNase III)
MKHKLEVVIGDITILQVDAIVNAANNSLLGGGGVDGAIHRAAGQGLLEECKTLNGCGTGEAKITKGYLLPAKYIIHTVGPVYYNWPEADAAKLLKNAYWNALQLTRKHRIKTIAFPNISTGVYAYPKEQAAPIAIDTCLLFLEKYNNLDQIVFCCFDQENYRIYSEFIEPL